MSERIEFSQKRIYLYRNGNAEGYKILHMTAFGTLYEKPDVMEHSDSKVVKTPFEVLENPNEVLLIPNRASDVTDDWMECELPSGRFIESFNYETGTLSLNHLSHRSMFNTKISALQIYDNKKVDGQADFKNFLKLLMEYTDYFKEYLEYQEFKNSLAISETEIFDATLDENIFPMMITATDSEGNKTIVFIESHKRSDLVFDFRDITYIPGNVVSMINTENVLVSEKLAIETLNLLTSRECAVLDASVNHTLSMLKRYHLYSGISEVKLTSKGCGALISRNLIENFDRYGRKLQDERVCSIYRVEDSDDGLELTSMVPEGKSLVYDSKTGLELQSLNPISGRAILLAKRLSHRDSDRLEEDILNEKEGAEERANSTILRFIRENHQS